MTRIVESAIYGVCARDLAFCQAVHLEPNGRNRRSGAMAVPRSRGTAIVVLCIYIRTSLIGRHAGGDARASRSALIVEVATAHERYVY